MRYNSGRAKSGWCGAVRCRAAQSRRYVMSASHSEFRPLGQPRRRRRRGGFTLVELLVVVGILILIIGILVPVVGRARAQAARTVCVKQLQTLGQAVIAFGVEHNATFPTC